MSYWSPSKPVASATPSILTRTPFSNPTVALCHGCPAALSLQDQALREHDGGTDGIEVGVGPTQSPGSVPGW